MIAAEQHPLYNRVALPRYLRGQVRREKVFMRSAINLHGLPPALLYES
jgi:hypothetical protein